MLDLGQQRIVAAVDVVGEEVVLLNGRIEGREQQVRKFLPSVVPAQIPLIADRNDPIATEIILREQRVTVGDRSRKIVLHPLQSDRRAADREIRGRIEALDCVGIHRPIRERVWITGNGVNNVRTKRAQVANERRIRRPVKGDGFLHPVVTDAESAADDQAIVHILLSKGNFPGLQAKPICGPKL